jgi:hypothetical protein
MFSGSYSQGEVTFLLQQLELQPIADVTAKEQLIQSGRHYSELIGAESQPAPEYLQMFEAAVQLNLPRLARDLYRLGAAIRARRPGEITLVSLARAGTPVGVALRHLYRDLFDLDVTHYSISIIRDRGIDTVALDYICSRHDPRSLVFVDGWTGKGTIGGELQRSLARYVVKGGQAQSKPLANELFVLCDLAGIATACGSTEDYLIPSAILNATVSGLVSRTILNEAICPGQFHGCLYYDGLAAHDRSRWFIERWRAQVLEDREQLRTERPIAPDLAQIRARSEQLVRDLMQRHGVADRNFIKPGIGEATRSLLRRVPRLLVLRDADAPSVRHLQWLAAQRAVPISLDPDLPLNAATILRKLADA